MNKITIILFAVTALVVNLAAQEQITFSDFIAEDGSGLDKLKKYQKMLADKKEVYTTHDTVSDACEQVELVTTLLDQAVIKKARKLPFEQGMIILKSHQLWWKYFDSTPSLPNINGSAQGIFSLMTDYLRIKSRWEAVRLPYEQYLVYAKIANLCQVRMNCGTYKMHFGEVCLKKEACWAHDADAVKTFGKYYHDFPVSILPEACRKHETGYVAVLKSAKDLYLCIWDQTGTPFAVHPLKDVKKIVAVTVEVDEVKIAGIDKQEKQYNFTFNLNESNQTKILTGE